MTDQSSQHSTSRLTELLDGPFGAGEITVTGLKEDIRHPMVMDAHTYSDGQLVFAATGVMVVGSDGILDCAAYASVVASSWCASLR